MAQRIAEMLDGTGLEIPFNTVTPELRDALIEKGIKIGKPEKGNAGAASREAYDAFRDNEAKFSLAGEPKPTFYSNAAKAVEGIRQEKATPEQWLAMITKAGGLKAGEDKWLGLSEWLKDKSFLSRNIIPRGRECNLPRKFWRTTNCFHFSFLFIFFP